MRSSALVVTGLLLVAGSLACGDGSENAEAIARDADDEQNRGAATFTVGGRTFQFDRVRCAFGPEETGREDTEFVLSAIEEGAQLEASIHHRFGHLVSLIDIENYPIPRVAWSAGEPGTSAANSDDFIRIDGKRLSVESTFENETSGETAEGTLRATCP